MKKAFTLVEMSIVLVIIGILMGLAVKGKELIGSARLKADINKVRNVKIALSIYLVDNSGSIKDNFSSKDLAGFLSPEDFILTTAVDPINVRKVWPVDQSSACSNNNCGGYIRDENVGDTLGIILGKISRDSHISNKVFGCKVDSVLDDKIQGSGNVRAYYYMGKVPFGPRTDELELMQCEASSTADLDYAMLAM